MLTHCSECDYARHQVRQKAGPGILEQQETWQCPSADCIPRGLRPAGRFACFPNRSAGWGKVLHLGTKTQMIVSLNAVMEEGNEACGQGDVRIEGLPGRLQGRRIVDGTMMLPRCLQGGMIGETDGAGLHAVNW